MRRVALTSLLIALTLSLTGCIMVFGVKDLPDCQHVVEIDGEWYVVDTKDHKLKKVEIRHMDEADDADEAGDASSDD